MRINMMPTKIIFWFAWAMATVMLSSQAPQAVLVDQDVAAPDEYPDGAGRGGDEWWRNYEVVEDRANELGDHLEMLYMYSVNPLELTTVRSARRRSTTTPSPQTTVSPVSRPQQFSVNRRPTTLATPPPPPPESPLISPASDFRVQPHAAVPPRSAVSEAQQFTLAQVPSEVHAPRQSFRRRHPSTLAVSQSQPTHPPFPNPAVSESQLAPRRHPSTFSTSSEPSAVTDTVYEPTGPWVQQQTFPDSTVEQLPAEQSQYRVEQPANVQTFSRQEASHHPNLQSNTPVEHPAELLQKPVFFVPSLPNTARTPAAHPGAETLQNTPDSDLAFSTFSSDKQFTHVPPTSQNQEFHTQPESHPSSGPSGFPSPSTAAFGGQSPVTPVETLPASGTTRNPFLSPAAVPVVQQRYSRLLNRYSLLDQVSTGEAAVPPDGGTKVLESNRLVRQPSSVGHAPFAPSSRNFLNYSSETVTTPSRRPRRRRLKTTTAVPTTEADTQLSDSEEVLFSQPQPRRRLKTTQGRFAPSTTVSATEIDSPASPAPLPAGFQAEPLSIQSPASRPIFSGSRGRTARLQQETTASGPPVSPLVREVAPTAPTGRDRSRNTRPQPFQTTTADLATESIGPDFSTSPSFSSFKSNRFQKTRPSFSPKTTSSFPELSSSPEPQDLALSSESSTARSPARRARFGASQSSRRFTPEAIVATSELPQEASTLPVPATSQQDTRSRRLKQRTSGQRFTAAPSVTTSPPSVTTAEISAPTPDAGSTFAPPQAAPLQSQSASKFKPRGSSFRRTTTPAFTTTVPTTAAPPTTIADTTAVTELTKQPETGTSSRFKQRPSKFRAFPAGTTTTTTTTTAATTIATTEATAGSASSTEALELGTTTKSRKFQPRNSFSRFQESPKRASVTTTETASETPTTTKTTSSKFFKSRAPFSRFQPGSTKAPSVAVTEATLDSSTAAEVTQPIFDPQLATSPQTSQRPLFKSRTGGQFPFRGTVTAATTVAPSSLAPIAEFSPADATPAVPVNTIPLAAAAPVESDSQTPFNSKRRRRPITKKSFSQAVDITSPTFASEESLSSLGQRQQESVVTHSVAATQSPIPVANEQSVPLDFQDVTPSSLESVTKRRKVRRRKLTKKRSTQSFSDERVAASEITKIIAKLTSAVTSATTENVTIATAMATAASTTKTASTIASTTTTASTNKTEAPVTAAITTTATTVAPLITTTLGKVLKQSSIAKEKTLEVKSGLSGKNAKKQLLLESVEEPLTAEADESGDDSGIWFSDSAGIGAEADSFAQGTRVAVGGRLSKLFQVEHEDAAIRNPPPAHIRRNSDGDDSKSWFGLADENGPKGADSSPEKTTVERNGTEHHQSRSLSESKPEAEEHAAQEEQAAAHDGQEVAADGDAGKENKTATFSVSSSTSVHTEVSKSRSSETAPEVTDTKEEDLKIENGPPPIIIIDKVSLSSEDRREEERITPSPETNSGNGGSELVEKESTTSTTTATTTTEEITTTEVLPSARTTPKTERASRGRTVTSTTARSSSRDKNSRTLSRDAAARNRASASRSESRGKSQERGRSTTPSRRDRTSTTTPAPSTTEEVAATDNPEASTENIDASEAPKKKPSDEVNYFGEDEVVPSSHGALDGPAEGELESGPLEADFQSEAEASDGEVASVDVSEHNDPNDRGHGSETAGDDDASRWELSPLSDFSGPIRESSSFNVEVLSKAPKQLQLASRRETKSSRSDLGDEFSNKRETRIKMRNFLKIIGLNAAEFDAEDAASGDSNGTETATKRVRVIPLKSFAFPVPPMKTPEDIAELFEIITSAPSGASRPFQPPSRAAILRINSTSSNDSTTPEGVAVDTNSASSLPASSFKIQTLNGPTNCSRSDRNICPMNEEYPRNLIELIVKQHEESVKRLWQDLEAKRTPAELFPEDSERKGEALSVCDSSIEALQPGWARDATTGKWMIIINTPDYPQILRVESCLRLKKECLFISPYYKSSCVEHYSAHRMVAIRPNDPASGPIVAIFKFPCGCSCKVGMLHGSN